MSTCLPVKTDWISWKLHMRRVSMIRLHLLQIYAKIKFHQNTSLIRTRNAWQSLACSPPGVAVSPPNEQ